ncbi:bifunctional 3-phenylpropionate/cinnamic acid dioxygenase ferredoxin subunit [Paraburkholderia sp. MMS20-SJTR3]|uniref:Bifunctional 3-phenylpropionate/cinnamic acid dioxygenase ferredoxin subunit n=1 Tax=Paraburkholderia sejongensis TaxID=2886946 RepID=A0ABS8K5D7_9BURK|nr:3-phenylpropionate/cinnamic acid dioxygenase ferredoxin subunit [Paraburkholderia sp. MMS20-SJTR3]MCC8397366.1 bifunctional 3-phenylpropionate/cinnamic acid dioxygenase ferredoxin subunit [Paraburkholderia sp. MMS20-SJTR3]
MVRIFVCKKGSLGEGETIKLEKAPIAVVNSGGSLYAVGDRCSHGNASMSEGYVEDDGTIECPLHSARFCLKTGAALCQPATVPLATYPVVTDGDRIFVDFSGVLL